MSGEPARALVLGAGGLLVLAGSVLVRVLTPAPLEAWRLHQLLLVAIGVGWIAGLAVLTHGSATRVALTWVWVVALAGRLALVGCEPNGDVHRYLWEGRVVLAGENPYARAPDDPGLAHLRRPEDGRVNHPEWTAIYGPAALAAFAVTVAIGGPSVEAWKLAAVAIDLAALAALALLLRRLGKPAGWIVGYAWHPLVLAMVAGEGHLEPLVVLPLALALACVHGARPAAAGTALGLAILVKPTAAVWLPLLAHRCGRAPGRVAIAVAATGLTVGLGVLPFADAGWGLFTSLVRFGREMRCGDFSTLLLGDALAPSTRLVAGAVVLVAIAALLVRSTELPERQALVLAGAWMLVSPTVHAWYGVPLAYLACAVGASAWWVLPCSQIALGETAAIERATGLWAEPGWTRAVAYGPLLLAAALGVGVRTCGRLRRERSEP